jgi:hypothetical protein
MIYDPTIEYKKIYNINNRKYESRVMSLLKYMCYCNIKFWISLSDTPEITKIREILNLSTDYVAVVEKNAHANAMAIFCSANH